MGANLTKDEILRERELIVEVVLNNLKTWDGIAESGIRIIEENEKHLDKFKTLDLLLKDIPIQYDEKYSEKMDEIIKSHKSLMDALILEQNQLVDLMQQVGKRDKVLHNYISIKKEPIFIDKDIK